MASLNKVMLIGNLGRDPELTYTPAGRAIAKFSLATTERWTNKADGSRQEKTEWHNIVLWDRQAEVANQYLKKGSSCYIEGRISTSSWEDKDKQKRYRTEIIGNALQLMGGGRGGDQPAPAAGPSQPQQPDEYFDAYPAETNVSPAAPDGGGGDDLPF